MLGGIALADKASLEREYAKERSKKHKKDKKKAKKSKSHKDKSQKKSKGGSASGSDSDASGSSGGGGGGSPPRGGGGSGGDGGGGGEAPARPQREDWMTVPMERSRPREEEAAEANKEPEKPAEEHYGLKCMDPERQQRQMEQQQRDGGGAAGAGEAAAAAAEPAAPAARRPAIGDGGASWRLKALKRAQEQARERGGDVSEFVAERWGSMAQLTKSLTEGRAAHDKAHLSAARQRAAGGITGLGSRGGGRDGDDGGDGDGERGGERGGRGGDRGGRGGGERGGDRGGGGDRERGGGGGGERGGPAAAAWLTAEQAAAAAGLACQYAQHKACAARRPDGRRGDERRRDERGGGRGGGRGGASQAQRELLESVAGSLNAFADDGSFLDRFKQPRGGNSGGEEGGPGSDEEMAEAGAGEAAAAAAPPPRQREQEQREQAPPQQQQQQAADGGGGGGGGNNRDVAAALRARLGAAGGGSNRDVAAALRARLGGRPAADGGGGADGAGPPREVVALPLVDASGRAAPGAFGRDGAGEAARRVEAAAGGRPAKRVQRYGKDGEKERYFADDDSVDLQTLVKRAKYGDDAGADDMDAAFARNVAAKKRYKGNELDPEEEYENDGGLEMFESRKRRGDPQQQAQRDKTRQIASFQRQQKAEDACAHCFSSSRRPRHLTIAIGQSTYLALVAKGRLGEGHCYIAPAEHVASMRQLDDAAWTEVRNFQKCLLQMAMASGRDVMFLETAMRLTGGRAHAVMEAVFVEPEVMAKAPLYFKQAIEHAESEWSTHHAKRLIDTKAKGLRGSVPPGFPYFYVQFGYAAGYAHVIDDESTFDRDFGRQVVVGLLRLPAEEMHRRQRPEPQAVQERAAAEFRRSFDKYDWTKALAG
ncbi:hypothetical protein Rsub_07300 [Raphidocelis subcapitata]|uniref:Cwf19-like C-terminal domain-containing protein n=1 Tax=Raphidocelis subcapitata TaxID=307507 RepID=A0A2V0P539_9CHLO|nr:hypothetical protein Rsub_07300 [Raphidocelis subcapitata]|eukprot:GBF94032.1 hypothetical protein Rsub_07300 [Raphidocelis subcapitata]